MTPDQALKRMVECVHMVQKDPDTSKLSHQLDVEALDLLRLLLKARPQTMTKEERLAAFRAKLELLCTELSVEFEPEDGHGSLLLIDREPSQAGFFHSLRWR